MTFEVQINWISLPWILKKGRRPVIFNYTQVYGCLSWYFTFCCLGRHPETFHVFISERDFKVKQCSFNGKCGHILLQPQNVLNYNALGLTLISDIMLLYFTCHSHSQWTSLSQSAASSGVNIALQMHLPIDHNWTFQNPGQRISSSWQDHGQIGRDSGTE